MGEQEGSVGQAAHGAKSKVSGTGHHCSVSATRAVAGREQSGAPEDAEGVLRARGRQISVLADFESRGKPWPVYSVPMRSFGKLSEKGQVINMLGVWPCGLCWDCVTRGLWCHRRCLPRPGPGSLRPRSRRSPRVSRSLGGEN